MCQECIIPKGGRMSPLPLKDEGEKPNEELDLRKSKDKRVRS